MEETLDPYRWFTVALSMLLGDRAPLGWAGSIFVMQIQY